MALMTWLNSQLKDKQWRLQCLHFMKNVNYNDEYIKSTKCSRQVWLKFIILIAHMMQCILVLNEKVVLHNKLCDFLKYHISVNRFHGNYSFLKVENVEIFIQFPHYGNFLLYKLNSCRGNYSRGELFEGRKLFAEIR